MDSQCTSQVPTIFFIFELTALLFETLLIAAKFSKAIAALLFAPFLQNYRQIACDTASNLGEVFFLFANLILSTFILLPISFCL